MKDFETLSESELDALCGMCGDDCDMAMVECVVRELRALRKLRDKQALHITHLVMQIRGKDWHEEVVALRAALAEACTIASDALMAASDTYDTRGDNARIAELMKAYLKG